MPVKTDKRTSNLFIAGGYCLVAVIILFNYLGQTESKERGKTELIPVVSSDVSSAISTDAMARQLEEEKRVNLEMREMIRRLQSAIGNQPVSLESVEAGAGPQDIFEIPEIKHSIIDDFAKQRSNPFIPGKNPFAAFRPQKDSAGIGLADSALALSLQCDPRLPFIITGANSKSGYFANF